MTAYPAHMRSSPGSHTGRSGPAKWDTAGLLLEASAVGGPLDFPAIFGNRGPVEVEIGTGKGTFLLTRAAAKPELNFLGIEYAGAYCRYAADRVRRAGLQNVRILHAEAQRVFATCLPAQCLLRVHVYFPDPWPKRKHHRRRLIQPAFTGSVRRVLRIGGQLIIVTDHQGYFLHIRRVLQDIVGLASIPMPQMCDAEDQITGTNFERKYLAQGRALYATARLRYL